MENKLANQEPLTAMESFKKGLRITGYNISKNSPAILMGFGIIGFGVTAVLAYKARPKVEKVVEEIEEKRENCENIDMVQVGKDVSKAVALPVIVGLMSAGAVMWSYRIQTNRIVTLSTVLAATQSAKTVLEEKVKAKFGEAAYHEMLATDEKMVRVRDEDGVETDRALAARAELDGVTGEWYDKSEDYVKDDHGYNINWAQEMVRNFEVKIFHYGWQSVNDLRRELKMPAIENSGDLMGWGPNSTFYVEYITINLENERTKEIEPNLRLEWKGAKYKYDTI